jgi:hypothetical protein
LAGLKKVLSRACDRKARDDGTHSSSPRQVRAINSIRGALVRGHLPKKGSILEGAVAAPLLWPWRGQKARVEGAAVPLGRESASPRGATACSDPRFPTPLPHPARWWWGTGSHSDDDGDGEEAAASPLFRLADVVFSSGDLRGANTSEVRRGADSLRILYRMESELTLCLAFFVPRPLPPI